MQKHWTQYTPEEQSFWNRYCLVVERTADANPHEAETAARLAVEMLVKRGYTRNDCPQRLKDWLRTLNLPKKIGTTRLQDIGRKSHGKRPWIPDIEKALQILKGSGSNRQIAEQVRALRNGKVPQSYEAIIRDQIQLNSSDSKKYKPHNSDLFKRLGKSKWGMRSQSHSPTKSNRNVPVSQTVQYEASQDTSTL